MKILHKNCKKQSLANLKIEKKAVTDTSVYLKMDETSITTKKIVNNS